MKQLWLRGDCALFLHGSMLGTQKPGLKSWGERSWFGGGGGKYGEEASMGCQQIWGWQRVRKTQLLCKWLRMLEASGWWLLCLIPGWGKENVLSQQNLVPIPLPHCPRQRWHLTQGVCNRCCSKLPVTLLEGLCSGNWAPACGTPGCQFQTICAWGDLFNLLHKQLLCLVKRHSVRGCHAVPFPSQPHLTLQCPMGTSASLSNSHVLICLYSFAYRTESCGVLFCPHLSCVSYCLTISL